MTSHRVLVAGLPRSGTTWVAEALGRTAGTRYVHEPDNDRLHPVALAAKAGHGRYPCLAPGDDAPAYRALWERAFAGPPSSGGTRARLAKRLLDGAGAAEVDRAMSGPAGTWPPRLRLAAALAPRGVVAHGHAGPVLVKSVHSGLSLPWLAASVPVDAGIAIVRHPANVIGSWRDMGWSVRTFVWDRPGCIDRLLPPGVAGPGPGTPQPWIARAAWQFALLATSLLDVAAAEGWQVVDHGELLDDPPTRLARVAAGAGLEWTDEATSWVVASNRPGEGYDLGRVAAAERERWRDRLDGEERAAVRAVLERFPTLHERWPEP